MKKSIRFFIIAMVLVVLYQSCATVPLTGRRQLSLVPESEMISMSLTNYSDFLKTNPISTDKTNTGIVQEVGSKIAAAVTKYFADNNLSGQLDGYKWEF